jgi:hypothetical protein
MLKYLYRLKKDLGKTAMWQHVHVYVGGIWSKHRDSGHEQLFSNGRRLKPAFAKRYKKQTTINLREISTNWF